MIKKIVTHRVFKNFTYLGIIQVFTYLSPLIVIPHLYKVIGLKNYGLFAFSNSFTFYFITIIDFGFQLYATKELAANKENKSYINKLYTGVYVIKALILLALIVVYFLTIYLFSPFKDNSLLFNISFLQVVGYFFLPIWIFQGFEKIRPLTVINSTSRVFFILSILLFVNAESDLFLVQLLNSSTIFVYGLISFFYTKRHFQLKFVNTSKAFCINIFKKSSLFFGSRIATSLYTVSNTVALGLLGGPVDAGIYSVAEKFYFGIQNLLQPITTSLYPYIAASKNVKMIKKLVIPLSLFFGSLCLISIYFAPELLHLIIKDINKESISVFRILGFVLIMTFPSLLLGFPVTAALGHDRLANIPLWIVAIMHVISIVVCQLLFGISPEKIAICLFITESSLLLIRIFIIQKYKLFSVEKK